MIDPYLGPLVIIVIQLSVITLFLMKIHDRKDSHCSNCCPHKQDWGPKPAESSEPVIIENCIAIDHEGETDESNR